MIQLLLESLDFLTQRFLVGDQMLDKIEQFLECLLGQWIQIDHRRQLLFDPLQNISHIRSTHTHTIRTPQGKGMLALEKIPLPGGTRYPDLTPSY